MLRRPVEQPQGLGPRRGIELARPRPDLDPRFDRPEPQIPPHGVARDLSSRAIRLAPHPPRCSSRIWRTTSASTIGTSALGGATLGVSVALFPPLSVPERRGQI